MEEEMENGRDMFPSYVGKTVLVVLKDGYKKKGRLLSSSDKFLSLWYLSGRQETIAVGEIKSVGTLE
jgi:hypothetical protein